MSDEEYLIKDEPDLNLTEDGKIMHDFFVKLSNPKIAKAAIRKVIEKDWELGIPVIQGDNKGMYELKPDGTKVYIK